MQTTESSPQGMDIDTPDDDPRTDGQALDRRNRLSRKNPAATRTIIGPRV